MQTQTCHCLVARMQCHAVSACRRSELRSPPWASLLGAPPHHSCSAAFRFLLARAPPPLLSPPAAPPLAHNYLLPVLSMSTASSMCLHTTFTDLRALVVGAARRLRSFSADMQSVQLAISLHAPTQVRTIRPVDVAAPASAPCPRARPWLVAAVWRSTKLCAAGSPVRHWDACYCVIHGTHGAVSCNAIRCSQLLA